jgi:hypothetical protein
MLLLIVPRVHVLGAQRASLVDERCHNIWVLGLEIQSDVVILHLYPE